MIKIRLSRRGAKNSPFYRIVAIDERKKQSGKALDIIGTWNPITSEIEINRKKYEEWVGKGAQTTKSVMKLIGK